MYNAFAKLLAAVVFAMSAAGVSAQVRDHKVLSLDGALKAIAAAMAEAKRLNAPGGSIAIVDEGGHVIAVERLDNTFPASATIAIGKARTSALFRKPTKMFEDVINKGRTAMTALPETLLTPLQGGVPIVVDDQVIGAIGVSGAASAQQGEDIAMVGAKAVAEAKTARGLDQNRDSDAHELFVNQDGEVTVVRR